jgi:hypothetical protein
MDREKSVQQTTAMQKELLGAWQQANRYWADRMQSEMALWADLGSKLVSGTLSNGERNRTPGRWRDAPGTHPRPVLWYHLRPCCARAASSRLIRSSTSLWS